MSDDQQDPGSFDLNLNPEAINTVHLKSIADAAKLADHLRIRWDELPKVPFYGGLFGYNEQLRRANIALSVLAIRSSAQRVLTPEELQIVAYMSARKIRRVTYEFPALLGTAYFLERRTRPSFGFPFFQPTETFEPNVFPSRTMQLLTGARARLMWHALRFSLYTAVSHFVLRIGFSVWASTTFAAEFTLTPQLADLNQTVKANIEAARNRKKPNPLLPAGQQHDDSSQPPMRGAPAEPGLPPALAQQQQQQEQEQYQQQYQRYEQYQRQQYEQKQQQEQQRGTDDYGDSFADDFADSAAGDVDDASPVAPSERRKEGPRWPTSGPGSSWDRLRSPGAPGQNPAAVAQAPPGQYGWDAVRAGKAPLPPPKQPPSAEGSGQTAGDYTFNEAEEEKSYARNQAQKDFDAMLERERTGENDESPKRW